jgi:hypothetical protein
MKSVLVILGCTLVAGSFARGQGVTATLAFEQEQYLPGETLNLKVRVSNNSGQTLSLGKDPGWLTFSVEDARHYVVNRQGAVPVLGEFTLESSTTGTKKVDLAPYFDLTRPGRYYVTATVNLPQWGQAVQSKAVAFDIIKGSSLWEKEFGVPSSASQSDAAPEVRRYALVQTLYSDRLRLYFRLTDTQENRVFRIFALGPMVSFGNLDAQLDKFSNLHVLYQTGGRIFMHVLINPDGLLIVRENYEYSDRRPVLRSQPDGRIQVEGGTRRVSPTDLPPPG